MPNPKFTVLFSGDLEVAHDQLQKLQEEYTVIFNTSENRAQFFKDLETKYNSFHVFFHTYLSHFRTGQIDEELVSKFPATVKAVVHAGAGYNQIDVGALTKRNIQLANTPGVVDRGTAETSLFLILGALRNFACGAASLRQGKWLADVPLGHDPAGKVLGIVGMGGIGQALRDRVGPFGFKKVVYYNRSRLAPELEKDTEYLDSLDALLAQADVVSLNLPLTKDSYHLINKQTIAKMKKGVVIVNTARGPIINEQDLVEGLESGQIGGVGLDVFENEPKIHPKLIKHPKALLLPHLGTHTVESRYDLELLSLNNVRSVEKTGKVITLVSEQRGIF